MCGHLQARQALVRVWKERKPRYQPVHVPKLQLGAQNYVEKATMSLYDLPGVQMDDQ